MNDTIVTVVGNVADSPRRNSTQNGAVTNFRLASTARRYDSGSEQFVDSGTFWVDVECWNGLSGNVSASLSKGDPVIVHGALTTHSWESDSGPRSKPRIKAFAVGCNLAKGTSVFRRTPAVRTAQPAEAGPAPAEAPAGEDFPGAGCDPVTGELYETDTGFATTDAEELEEAAGALVGR
ncbi:single-stranded DNA-binding protein [Blastococcus sp. VKM Ac-2987]|uniref:single-stranded DNA-binding protein n=1 Tax=Blastococcus sp. VKM Ac-2987 TaxID=3004141 RepID=UPI0022AB89EA|nr:single-stranded DNA-binding protein [Blastococcus sp. VKM Ac-2987]MCZ2857546.1 single-stranded DNA-binding protein [Blastococcus sp. VKM Ac-2987]